ncbi:MAG: hypothetical protein ABIJ97_13920, partial [Bacteroidota bacterium]
MKRNIIFIIFLFVTTSIVGQDLSTNNEKYWSYRNRLKKYFVKIGDNIGESNVASVRNFKELTLFHMGDQTVDLAWYLGVLATEYELLRQNGQDVERTLVELYYAMKAFERLDYCETKGPWYKSSAAVDGFFVRFDPELYYNNSLFDINERNPDLTANDLFGSKEPGIPTYINSSHVELPDEYGIAMSQDQAIHLLMGFALIRKLLPPMALGFEDLDGNTIVFNFHSMSKYYANNIVEYVQNRNEDYGPDKWKIYDPDGDIVTRGHNAIAFAHGIIKSAQSIFSYPYSDNWSETASAELMWQTLSIPNPYEYNSHMACVLAALSDTWDWGVNTTGFRIYSLASVWNWDTFYLLLYDIINDKTTSYLSISKVEDQLNTAPSCGPYLWDANNQVEFECCGFVSGKPTGGWASSNKFRHTKEEQQGFDENGNTRDGTGNFHGLDFMLLYNLYRLHEQPIGFVDLIDIKISNLYYPYVKDFGYPIEGNNFNPATIQAFETIEVSNMIVDNKLHPDFGNPNGTTPENANVTMRAGKKIILKPGFKVE